MGDYSMGRGFGAIKQSKMVYSMLSLQPLYRSPNA